MTLTIPCACGREQCKDEMKVVPVKIEGAWTIMLHIARNWEWGTTGVRTVCLTPDDRAHLISVLGGPEAFADEA